MGQWSMNHAAHSKSILVLHDLKAVSLVTILPVIEKQEIQAVNKPVPVSCHVKGVTNEVTELELQLVTNVLNCE